MAARLNPRHQDAVREKIKASQLINRLTNHALGLLKKPMDATQVAAARAVLDKAIPNAPQHSFVQQELSGPNGGPIEQKIEQAEPRPRMTPEEWLAAHGVDLKGIADGVGPATRTANERTAG